MTNRASVLWKILKKFAKKWPEMVVKTTIVTTRLGETVFTTILTPIHISKSSFHSNADLKEVPGWPDLCIQSVTEGLKIDVAFAKKD